MEHRRAYIKTISIDAEKLIRRINEGAYCCDFATQRTPDQWSREQNSLLIDSMMRGYGIPNIWVCTTPTDTYAKNSVIDGLQRITAISSYMKDEFALSNSIKPVTLSPDDVTGLEEEMVLYPAGKKFSKLPVVLQRLITDCPLTIFEMENFTDEEIEDQFYRLNNGCAMTFAQKLRIMLGNDVAEKIQEVEDLPFWRRTKFTRNQLKHGELCATILQCLMVTTDYEYNGFTKGEMAKFAAYYADACKEREIKALVEIIEKLDGCMLDKDENKAFLSKANIPALVACTKKFMEYEKSGEFTEDSYTEFLEDWVDHNAECSGYIENSEAHTTEKKSAHARIAIINEWLEMYVKDKKAIEVPCSENVSTALEETDENYTAESEDAENYNAEEKAIKETDETGTSEKSICENSDYQGDFGKTDDTAFSGTLFPEQKIPIPEVVILGDRAAGGWTEKNGDNFTKSGVVPIGAGISKPAGAYAAPY